MTTLLIRARALWRSSLNLSGAVAGLTVFGLVLSSCSDGTEVVRQVKNRELIVRDTTHKQTNDFLAEGSADSAVDEIKLVDTFKVTVHPLLLERCSACHSGTVAPYFAASDPVQAYKALSQSGKVDFGNPSNSRLVQRLAIESHNCWNDCPADAEEMRTLVQQWIDDSGLQAGEAQTFELVTPEIVHAAMPKTYEAAPPDDPNAPPTLVELVVEAESLELPPNWQTGQTNPQPGEEQRTFITALSGGNMYTEEEVATAPNVPEFSFLLFVPEDRNYHFYAIGSGLENSDDEFFFKIDQDETWSTGRFSSSGEFVVERFARRDLEPGPHFVTIRQKAANIRIDKFLVTTRGPNANNRFLTNFTDMTLAPGPIDPRFMSFDISAITNVPGSTFVVSAEAFTESSYYFTSPFVLVGSKAFRVQGIRPLVNGVFGPQHTHWLGVDAAFKAPFGQLSTIGLPILSDKGPAEDRISFAFDSFEEIDPATVE